MKRYPYMRAFTTTALIVALAIAGRGLVGAEDTKPAPAPGKEQAEKTELFSGKIEEVNLEGKWLKVAKQTYAIGEKTKLLNQDKEIKLEDLKAGTEIHGLARKAEDGKLVATIVKVGPRPHEDKSKQPKS